jgi:tetratricopeptide (TPR) repeat protein
MSMTDIGGRRAGSMPLSRRVVKSLWPRPAPLGLGTALVAFAVAACMGGDPGPLARMADAGDPRLAWAGDGKIPSSPLGNYLAGNFALNHGELEEAATYFELALAGAPDNLELLDQLFLLTLAAGQFGQALDQAERLVEQGRGADEAVVLLALGQVRDQEFEEAKETLGRLDEDGIAALAAPFLEAWAIFAAGGPDATTRAIARLEAGEPLGPLNEYHAAMLQELGGHPDEARALLGGAMPEQGRAPLRLLQAYAVMLARAGQHDAAVDLIQAEVGDGVDQPLLNDTMAALRAGEMPALPFTGASGGMADALLGIAEALHQERGGSRAVVYARLATFLEPQLAEGFILIGDVMAEQGNYDAAIEAYRTVDDGGPLSYAARLREARALHAMERKEDAYGLLDEVAQAEPKRVEALIQLGDLLRGEEQYERAESAYSRAVERIGDVEREHWTLLYARGITYERTKRWPQAEADFLEALDLEPEQPFVLNYLGYSWVDQGMHLDRAKGMLRRAVELRPNDGFIIDSLGWVHYRLGDYRAAVERLERAVELEPGDPIINDHLGDAYWRVGREREARYQWRRALSLEPEDDAVADIEQKLKSGLPAKSKTLDRS